MTVEVAVSRMSDSQLLEELRKNQHSGTTVAGCDALGIERVLLKNYHEKLKEPQRRVLDEVPGILNEIHDRDPEDFHPW